MPRPPHSQPRAILRLPSAHPRSHAQYGAAQQPGAREQWTIGNKQSR